MIDQSRIFVTGASGQLGRGVIDTLLERLPADSLAAGVRDLGGTEASDLRRLGVQVCKADYTQPRTLELAFEGVDRLLLVSSSENGRRKSQHRNVIEAAKAAGVQLIAYTSVLRADTSPFSLAEEHRDTEAAVAGSVLPFVLLRNGWYNEVFTWRLPAALEGGVILGAGGSGRISSAARADYARAAATVLVGEGHAGRTYELAGDAAFTLQDLAPVVAKTSGKPMTYEDLPREVYQARLRERGSPAAIAELLADIDAGIAQGALCDDSRTLSKLIGRPTTPIAQTITRFMQETASRS